VIRTRPILFLLAAFLGWLPCARASLPALRDGMSQTRPAAHAFEAASTWELAEVHPFGFTDDGTPLALFVFVELPDPFDMFAPVSTRAGPKTHTRVLYVVQPVLGLKTVKEYQDIIAALVLSEREALEFTRTRIQDRSTRSDLIDEIRSAYSVEIRENRRRMFQLEEELKLFAYRRSQRRMLRYGGLGGELSTKQLDEMLDDELKYLLENISDRDEAALGWIRGEASIYRAAEISANEIRNSLFQLSASRALYTNQFKPTVPEVYRQGLNFGTSGTLRTETFYRTMSKADYETYLRTGRVPATSETFISPTQAFSEGFDGVLMQFHVKPGTTQALRAIGVRDTSRIVRDSGLGDLPLVSPGWTSGKAFFKGERGQVNIGLGQGEALNIFNSNIQEATIIWGAP
jgi:hypothetical protein